MWLPLFLYIIITVVVWKFMQKPKKFPPGPPSFPLVGNFFTFRRLVKDTGYFHLAVSRLGEKYGKIVGMQLGSGPPTIFVLGYEAVTEALANSNLDGRPDSFMDNLRTMGKRRGIICTDQEFWHTQRRYLLRNLRDFGFGKRSMEMIIQEEALKLVNHLELMALESPEGLPLDSALTRPVLNSLWSIVSGVRFEEHDSRFRKYLQSQEDFIRKLDSSGGLINIYPWLRYILPEKSGYNQMKTHHTDMWTFFSEIVNKHKVTLKSNVSRDLIDAYLHEISSNTADDSFSEAQLISILKDLFVAGAETTSNTLAFFFLYMVLHPEIQTKVHEEIDHVVGNELPSIINRKDMPYLSAVLQEVQRISNIGPLTLPHRALADVDIQGYTIPKNCTVLMSLYSVHMDKDYWKDPEVFKPERHLSPEGLFLPQSKVIPFGSGHRRCLGETFAKNSLFLFTTIILQSIFVCSSDKQILTTMPKTGLTLAPKSYQVIIKRRK